MDSEAQESQQKKSDLVRMLRSIGVKEGYEGPTGAVIIGLLLFAFTVMISSTIVDGLVVLSISTVLFGIAMAVIKVNTRPDRYGRY